MKYYFTFFTVVTILFSGLFLYSDSALAQEGLDNTPTTDTSLDNTPTTDTSTGGAGGAVKIENPLAFDSLTDFFLAIIEILLIFAIPIIVFFIIYAGFLYVTAQGNAEQVQKASRALLYAIIGGLLILGANLILSVIQSTVNSFTV